ncbi:MAG: hypothetical protein PVF58_04655 [Candidatus Methanofastidiosia archaeon]|jgi:hypothetical protein
MAKPICVTPEERILKYVLQPLIEAYKIVRKDPDMVSANENTITNKIVWHLKENTSISYYYRKKLMYIVIRPQEQCTIDSMYEPDIKFIINTLWIEIESKRIYEKNKWSTAEYLGEKGVKRFIEGKYAHEDFAAMIGYIQNGNFQKIVHAIKDGLQEITCTKCEDIVSIENCLLSVHIKNEGNITIYHLFFYFS